MPVDRPLARHSATSRHPGSSLSLVSELHKLREEAHTGDHYLTPTQLEAIYRTNVKTGLTDEFAAELLLQNGPNELVDLASTSYWKIFRHNLFGWFQCVLWIGAILNFIAHFIGHYIPHEDPSDEHIYLGVVICLTVLGTGFFGFYQEAKNAHVMSGFEKMVPPNAFVIRDGIKRAIPSTGVVIGDIVEMSGGEVVPADVRILTCTNFQTDMSSLTGESIPIKHTAHCTHHNPLESKNMAFFSCCIVQGTARGVVVAVGELTQIGRIAGLVTGLEKDKTPIAKEITHFIKILCGVSFTFGLLFFIMVYIVNKSILSGFQYMLGIILANVPEGLIVTLTVCMTLSAKRLKSKNCLAKTLQAVETLGSTSCICTDKTGTLTENLMSVSHLFCNWKVIDKSDKSFGNSKTYNELCLAASLCLKAEFSHDTKHLPIFKRQIIGDASESAILRYMEANRNATALREENVKVCEIPFSSEYKYQVSIHRMPNETYYLVLKGAPDIVIDFCSTIATDEADTLMNATNRRDLKTQFTNFGKIGERVLGYCDIYLPPANFPTGYKFDSQEINFPLNNLRFVGLISLIDPPREGIRDSISLCKQAGIKVVMVTGDHPVTALAISRQVGTISDDSVTAYDYAFEHDIEVTDVPEHIKLRLNAAVISGDELRLMCAETLKAVIRRYPELTFARTSPQQKLFIVETFQNLEYVVAVTGDGVNDSPALKKADIGIAMGITGTEVSKQAADMILLDDNFSSIVLGVEEGRRIFDNLKKTIAYTLTSNTPEMMPFVLYAIAGIPLPLTIILILVINVGTDILPAMSLAYETSEVDIMSMPPRKPTDHLVNKVLIYMAYFQVGMIQFFAGLYAYLVTMAEGGFFPGILLGIRNDWDSKLIESVTDSYGVEWAYSDRKLLERKAQTAYFFATCLTQVADVIICKTRRISLLKKGMHNHVLNFSILVNLGAATAAIFIPFFNTVLGTYPIEWYSFFLAVPFGVLMILVDEIRRYLIRNNKSKWLEEETYY